MGLPTIGHADSAALDVSISSSSWPRQGEEAIGASRAFLKKVNNAAEEGREAHANLFAAAAASKRVVLLYSRRWQGSVAPCPLLEQSGTALMALSQASVVGLLTQHPGWQRLLAMFGAPLIVWVLDQ